MVKDAAEKEIMFHDELNNHMGQGNFHRQRPFHATIHVTSQEGLKKIFTDLSRCLTSIIISVHQEFRVLN